PRYLAERGDAAEADAVVRRVERAGGGAMLILARAVAPPRAGRARIADLFAPRYVRRTVMLWILWFGITLTYYGIFLYVPSLLVARGLTDVRSNEFFFLSTIAQVPGYFSAAWLVERWGRKPTLIAYLLGSAASAFLFGNSGTGTDTFIYASFLSFFNLGAWGVVYSLSPELYPTAIRATGAGVAAAVGRIGGIIGPFLTPVLVPSLGRTGVFAMFMALLVLTALAVAATSATPQPSPTPRPSPTPVPTLGVTAYQDQNLRLAALTMPAGYTFTSPIAGRVAIVLYQLVDGAPRSGIDDPDLPQFPYIF